MSRILRCEIKTHTGGRTWAKRRGGIQGMYYIRIDNNTDPNDGFKRDTSNGGGFGTSASGGRGF